MKKVLFLVLFAVLVNMAQSGRWWRRAKDNLRQAWRENKGKIIEAIIKGRDVDGLDANQDGLLDSTELESHFSQRDLDTLMNVMDIDDDGALSTEEMKREIGL